ncbi:MAG: PIN domain-containing protein [Fimbriimonadales bacterium]|nr:PIN domain-containing protein [Fimbriimonadales bacterium]
MNASRQNAGRYLLDTSVAAEILRGRLDLKARLGEQARFYLCGITVGELYYGASVSARPEYQRQVIEALVGDYSLLAFGRAVQRAYAQVKQFLRAQGTPIPENDVWIAAFALAYRLPLLTLDRHFEALQGLTNVDIKFL